MAFGNGGGLRGTRYFDSLEGENRNKYRDIYNQQRKLGKNATEAMDFAQQSIMEIAQPKAPETVPSANAGKTILPSPYNRVNILGKQYENPFAGSIPGLLNDEDKAAAAWKPSNLTGVSYFDSLTDPDDIKAFQKSYNAARAQGMSAKDALDLGKRATEQKYVGLKGAADRKQLMQDAMSDIYDAIGPDRFNQFDEADQDILLKAWDQDRTHGIDALNKALAGIDTKGKYGFDSRYFTDEAHPFVFDENPEKPMLPYQEHEQMADKYSEQINELMEANRQLQAQAEMAEPLERAAIGKQIRENDQKMAELQAQRDQMNADWQEEKAKAGLPEVKKPDLKAYDDKIAQLEYELDQVYRQLQPEDMRNNRMLQARRNAITNEIEKLKAQRDAEEKAYQDQLDTNLEAYGLSMDVPESEDPLFKGVVTGTGWTAINALSAGFHGGIANIATGTRYAAELIENALGISHDVSNFLRRSEKYWRGMEKLSINEMNYGKKTATQSVYDTLEKLTDPETAAMLGDQAKPILEWIEDNLVQGTFENTGNMIPSIFLDLASGGTSMGYDIYKAGETAYGALAGRGILEQFASGVRAAMSNAGFPAVFAGEYFSNLAEAVDSGKEPTPTDMLWMLASSYASALIEYGGDDVASGFQALLMDEVGGLKGFIHAEVGESVEELTQQFTQRVGENIAAVLQGKKPEYVLYSDQPGEALICLAEMWDTTWRTWVTTAGMSGMHYVAGTLKNGIVKANRGEELSQDEMQALREFSDYMENKLSENAQHADFEAAANGEETAPAQPAGTVTAQAGTGAEDQRAEQLRKRHEYPEEGKHVGKFDETDDSDSTYEHESGQDTPGRHTGDHAGVDDSGYYVGRHTTFENVPDDQLTSIANLMARNPAGYQDSAKQRVIAAMQAKGLQLPEGLLPVDGRFMERQAEAITETPAQPQEAAPVQPAENQMSKEEARAALRDVKTGDLLQEQYNREDGKEGDPRFSRISDEELKRAIRRKTLQVNWGQTKTENFRKWFGKSKQVGENGKPVVYMHGTNAQFDRFDLNRIGTANDKGYYGKGIYLALYEGSAKFYGDNVMRLFVRAENPYNIYNELLNGKGDTPTLFQNITEKLPELADTVIAEADAEKGQQKDLTIGEYTAQFKKALEETGNWREAEQKVRKDNPALLNHISTWYIENKIDLTEALKKRGYDSIEVTEGPRELIVFDPKQLKSATGNTGKFDIESDNIYDDDDEETTADEVAQDPQQPQVTGAPEETKPEEPQYPRNKTFSEMTLEELQAAKAYMDKNAQAFTPDKKQALESALKLAQAEERARTATEDTNRIAERAPARITVTEVQPQGTREEQKAKPAEENPKNGSVKENTNEGTQEFRAEELEETPINIEDNNRRAEKETAETSAAEAQPQGTREEQETKPEEKPRTGSTKEITNEGTEERRADELEETPIEHQPDETAQGEEDRRGTGGQGEEEQEIRTETAEPQQVTEPAGETETAEGLEEVRRGEGGTGEDQEEIQTTTTENGQAEREAAETETAAGFEEEQRGEGGQGEENPEEKLTTTTGEEPRQPAGTENERAEGTGDELAQITELPEGKPEDENLAEITDVPEEKPESDAVAETHDVPTEEPDDENAPTAVPGEQAEAQANDENAPNAVPGEQPEDEAKTENEPNAEITEIERETEEQAKKYGFQARETNGWGSDDPGVHLVRTDGRVSEENYRALKQMDPFLKAAGISVEMRDDVPEFAQGKYNGKGVITLSTDTEDPMMAVFGHELTHHIQRWSPESATKIWSIFKKWADRTGFDADRKIQTTLARYERAGALQGLNQQQKKGIAMMEISADFAAPAFMDMTFAKEVYVQDRNLLERVIDWARQMQANIQEMLKRFTAGSDEERAALEYNKALKKIQQVGEQAIREIKELDETKKVAAAVHGNGEMSRKYEREVRQATSKRQIIEAGRSLAGDVLTQTGNEVNKGNITRLMYAASNVYSGTLPYNALKDNNLKATGIDDDTRRSMQMLGEYVQHIWSTMDTDSHQALVNGEWTQYQQQDTNEDGAAGNDEAEDRSGDNTDVISRVGDKARTTSGEELYSLKSMTHDYDTYRQIMDDSGLFTDEETDHLFEVIDKTMAIIRKNPVVLDLNEREDKAGRAFSPVKPNSDSLYKVSLDFSTLCRKRLLQQTVQEIIEKKYNTVMTKGERVALRNALKKVQQEGKKIEIACALCYVESARLKSPEQIRRFLSNKRSYIVSYLSKTNKAYSEEIQRAAQQMAVERGYAADESLKSMKKKDADVIRAMKRKMYQDYMPSAEEERMIREAETMDDSMFKTAEGLGKLKTQYPVLFDAYTTTIRNATKSKGLEGDVAYYAKDTDSISDALIAAMNEENGLRSQSWSDFQVKHLLDYMGAIIDLSVRKAKMQAYTKVPEYARLMGKTGQMINLSLIPKDYDGKKLEYDSAEGMDYEIAQQLRKEFPDTEGVICIGIRDDHIVALLRSDDIDYVIPYHKSSMDKETRRRIGLKNWSEYESQQNEKANDYEMTVHDENYHKKPSFSEWYTYDKAKALADEYKKQGMSAWEASKAAMTELARQYVELCHSRGLQEKFAKFSNEEGYWKLLIDRKMINQVTGELIEQKAVRPVFDENVIADILDSELDRVRETQPDMDEAVNEMMNLWEKGEIQKEGRSKAVQKQVKAIEEHFTKQLIVDSSSELDNREMYSLKDDGTDAEYMKAVESGDVKKQQEMVNEAAEKAGFTAVDRFHQTGTRFTKFNTNNPVAGANDSDTPNGIFLKDNDHDIGVGGDYVKTGHGGNIQMRLYLKSKNMLHFANRKEAEAWYKENVEGYKELSDKWDEIYKTKYEPRFNAINEEMFDKDTSNERYEELSKEEEQLIEKLSEEETLYRGKLRKLLDKHFLENDSGYDGIELDFDGRRYIDGKREDVHTFIVFDPSQVKSADPVTYDDKGNVIPLSQRFNTEEEDIRYSLKDDAIDAGRERSEDQLDIAGGNSKTWDLMNSLRLRMADRKSLQYGQWKQGLAEMARDKIEQTGTSVYDEKKMEAELTRIFDEYEKKMQGVTDQEGMDILLGETVNELKALYQTALSDQLYDDELQQVRDVLRKGIYINKAQAKEIGGSAEMRDIRNRLSGIARIYTSEKAADKAGALRLEGGGWDDLQAVNPHLFDPDMHWLERLQAIADFVGEHSDDAMRMDPQMRNYIADLAMTTMAEYYQGISTETDANKRTREALDRANKKVDSLTRQMETGMKQQAELNRQLKEMKTQAAAAGVAADREAMGERNRMREEMKRLQAEQMKTVEELNAAHKEAEKLHKQLSTKDNRAAYLQQKIREIKAEDKKKFSEMMQQGKQKWKAQREQRESDRKARDTIRKAEMKMRRMLEKPSNTAYVPLDKVRQLLNMVEAIQGADTRKTAQATESWMRAVRELKQDTNSVLKDAYDAESIEMMQAVADLMREKKINELDSEELQFVSNVVTQTLHQIENATKMIGRQKNADAFLEAQSFTDTVNAQKQRAASGIGKVAGDLMTEHLTPQRELEKLAGFRKDNAVYRMNEDLSQGQRDTNRIKMESTKVFEPLLTGENAKRFRKFTGKDAELVDTGIEGSRHGTFKITQDMRAALLMHSMNQQNVDGMKNGLTVPDIELLKKGKIKEAWDRAERMRITPEQLQRIVSGATEYERQWAKAWQKYQEYITPKLNDASMKLNGWHRFTVPNYFPIRRDGNYLATDFESLMLDNRIASMGFAKQRKNAKNPMMLQGMYDVVNKTINGSALYAGMLIPVTNFNKVFNMSMPDYEDSPKAAIRRVFGNKDMEFIERMMTDVQQAGVKADESFLDKLRGKAAPAALGANATVVIKQAASYPTAAAVLGWSPLAKQLAKPRKFDEKIVNKYTSAYWERSDANIAAMNANVQNGSIDRTSGWLNKPIGAMDRATVRMLWGASEYAVEAEQPNLKRGTDEYYEAVARKWEECLEMTQPEYGTMQRPHALRSNNTLYKSMNMYKTQSFQNLNILYDAVADYRTQAQMYKKNKTNENKAELDRAKTKLTRAVTSQVVSATVLAIMTAVGKALLHKPEPYQDDKGEITAASAGYQLSKDAISSMAGMVMGGSELFDLITGIAEGKAPYDIDSSAVSMINDLYQSIYKLGTAAAAIGDSNLSTEQKKQKALKAAETFLQSAGSILGVPVKNMENIGKSAYKYADDIISGRGIEGLTQGDVTLNKAARYMGEALQKGDKETYVRLYNRLLKSGKTNSQINSAMKSWLKTGDQRVQQAAAAIDSGDLDTYNRMINDLTADGFGMSNAVSVIETVRKAQAAAAEDELEAVEPGTMTYDQIMANQETGAQSAYTYAQMNSMLDNGNITAAKKIQSALFKSKGTTAVKSALTSYWKPKYLEAQQARNSAELSRIKRLLKQMGLTDQSISKWKAVDADAGNARKSGFGSSFGSSKKSSKKKSSFGGGFGSGGFGRSF